MNKEQLKEKYPKAWAEVMSNPLSMLWSTMENDKKEEILIGITKNLELKHGN